MKAVQESRGVGDMKVFERVRFLQLAAKVLSNVMMHCTP
jgi:hypothetical protein